MSKLFTKIGISKTWGAMLAVYIIWGTTLGSMRIGVATIPPELLVCIRFTTAGFLMTFYCLAIRKEPIPLLTEIGKQSLIGFLLFCVGNAMSTWAIQYMPTGLAGIMVATTPFWMVGLSAVFPPQERIKPLVMLGIFIGFVGMIILLSPQLIHPHDFTPMSLVAIGIMLATAFFWSVGSVYARKQTLTSSIPLSVGLQNLVAGILLMPLCFAMHAEAPNASLASIGALSYLIVFGTIVATPCYFYVLKNLPVSVTSTFAYVTPILTVIFGILFLGESLTPPIIIGSLVILTGVMLVQFLNQKPVAKPAATIHMKPIQPLDQQPLAEQRLESLTG